MAILNLEVLMDDNNVPTDYHAIFGTDPGVEGDVKDPAVEAAEEMADATLEAVEAAVEATVEAATGADVTVEVVNEEPVAFPQKTAVVDIDPVAKLRLRSMPDKKADILAMLTDGTKLTVISDENPEWLEVQFVDEFSEVKQGFVNKSFVTLENE
jgi:uncharacterized protein YgiM (DUF1202 family)